MPISTVYKAIKKRFTLYTYKVQIVQALGPDDRPMKVVFATYMIRNLEDDAELLNRIMFSDEACFHLSDIANCHYLRKWGSEYPTNTVSYKGTPQRLMCGVD
ncbi:uncharacterized protein NPIL_137751 [Nephila pilipes]|uniref:Transposase n=1 Tax=Nephila pilipes TaxID=299642 RepID=A0A8X6TBM0_NEPPI|nr:uncharacterized protein NPIL_137751 [Nephila pilipes]